MADPRAFISFDFDNNEESRRLFVGQGKENSPTPFVIEDWSSKTALEEDEWKEKIAAKIAACNMVIVLVGRSAGSAVGVSAEIAMAKDKNVPVFGVYVDGATSSNTMPSGLPSGRVISWKWDAIADAIKQVMGELKNA
jgi:hypothetical protein